MSPLSICVARNMPDLVRRLLELGADATEPNWSFLVTIGFQMGSKEALRALYDHHQKLATELEAKNKKAAVVEDEDDDEEEPDWGSRPTKLQPGWGFTRFC